MDSASFMYYGLRHLSLAILREKLRMLKSIGKATVSCLIFLLAACVSNTAPVVEGWKTQMAASSDYLVQPGDSLYSVAWAFDMDYKQLAALNNLSEPYAVKPGQKLKMSTGHSSHKQFSAPKESQPAVYAIPAGTQPTIVATNAPLTHHSNSVDKSIGVKSVPNSNVQLGNPNTDKGNAVNKTIATTSKENKASPNGASNIALNSNIPKAEAAPKKEDKIAEKEKSSGKGWLWPTQGQVLRNFSSISGGNRGIDIGGHLGQNVLASMGGKVVYTGSSMPGYGNLIIIKHNDSQLSAYAFNKKILIKEGDLVKTGQVIANMGKNDANQAVLHFEIRQNGKPVDPKHFLQG